MKNLKETIIDFPLNTELHQYGFHGCKEYRLVEMKSWDAKDYKNYQLWVFPHYMVAVEHYTEEVVQDTNYWLWATIEKKAMRRFSMHYKIREFDEISQPKKIRNKWIVEFKAFTHFKVDGKKSLSFRFSASKEQEAKMFRNYFDDLKEKIEYEECSVPKNIVIFIFSIFRSFLTDSTRTTRVFAGGRRSVRIILSTGSAGIAKLSSWANFTRASSV